MNIFGPEPPPSNPKMPLVVRAPRKPVKPAAEVVDLAARQTARTALTMHGELSERMESMRHEGGALSETILRYREDAIRRKDLRDVEIATLYERLGEQCRINSQITEALASAARSLKISLNLHVTQFAATAALVALYVWSR